MPKDVAALEQWLGPGMFGVKFEAALRPNGEVFFVCTHHTGRAKRAPEC
jgi:hypothetical protein